MRLGVVGSGSIFWRSWLTKTPRHYTSCLRAAPQAAVSNWRWVTIFPAL